MRLWATAFALLLCCGTAMAEQFAGRPLEITDGRATARPGPLVVALHGFTGTGASFRRKTHFDALALRDHFVVVYPSGRARRWSDGATARGGPDDVAYLSALIDALVTNGLADPARVYLVGHSNGGGMALRMACDRPDLIAGIVVVAMNTARAARCPAGAALPVLFIHGHADPIVPPQGLAPRRRHSGYVSSAQTLAQWARRNGCDPSPSERRLARAPQVAYAQYTNCRADLMQVRIDGHGHEWPGAGPRAAWLQGPATDAVDAAALSWWFFENI